MRNLLLLVALWAAVTFYFPDSRIWIAEVTRPLWVPVVKWSQREEMRQVAGDVVAYEAIHGRLPDRRNWVEWMEERYSTEHFRKDTWGSHYQLRVWADSVAIWSYGPDKARNTEDDFQVSAPRQRRRR